MHPTQVPTGATMSTSTLNAMVAYFPTVTGGVLEEHVGTTSEVIFVYVLHKIDGRGHQVLEQANMVQNRGADFDEGFVQHLLDLHPVFIGTSAMPVQISLPSYRLVFALRNVREHY